MAQMNDLSWISRGFKEEKGTFSVSGVGIDAIAENVSPPFYVYDAATIRQQYTELHHAMESHNIAIYYSVKANTSLAVLKILKELGAGFEVASLGELLAVKTVGIDPNNVSFAGPVKTEDALRFAIALGVSVINVESISEIYRINALAKEKGIKQRIGIRVNPKKEVAQAGGFMGGGSQKFGFDEEALDKHFFKEILSLQNLDITGVHVFAATQMLDEKSFLANIENTCIIAQRLQDYFLIQNIDFGGGLGIPYTQNEQSLPLAVITKELRKILRKFQFIKQNNVKLIIEPGRFLVGSSGIYVAQVDNVKHSRGKEILLVDGGINHMLRPVLTVGSSSHPVYNLSRLHEKPSQKYDVGGALCTSLDFLAQDVFLPETKPGDLLGIFNAGAYGWSEAMPYFLSHGMAAEILVDQEKFFVIRDAIHPREYLYNQHMIQTKGARV